MHIAGRYYTYITTNQYRTVLYTGVTNDPARRLSEHLADALHHGQHFAGRYQAFCLLWYEAHQRIEDAIAREKQIKGWTRARKLDLIRTENPELQFMNDNI